MFAALDVTTTDVGQLQRMLGRWAAIAARLTAGKQVSDSAGARRAAAVRHRRGDGPRPALADHHGRVRPSLFDDRFGLAARCPPELTAARHHSRATP